MHTHIFLFGTKCTCSVETFGFTVTYKKNNLSSSNFSVCFQHLQNTLFSPHNYGFLFFLDVSPSSFCAPPTTLLGCTLQTNSLGTKTMGLIFQGTYIWTRNNLSTKRKSLLLIELGTIAKILRSRYNSLPLSCSFWFWFVCLVGWLVFFAELELSPGSCTC
jgi:hypothetical protein